MAPVVIITGASEGGIGFSLCEAFAAKGCVVYATARKLSSMASLPAQIHKLELDVTSQESCENAVKTILAAEGKVDILVNNAGRGGSGALLDVTLEDAKGTFETNLWGAIRLSQIVVPHFIKQRKGLVINIGSIVGVFPTPFAGVYAASKAALHSWTDTLRMEVNGFGVDVFLVVPGSIKSNFGNKQVESINMPENSLYSHVADKIMERANLSQKADKALPSPILAAEVVKRSLRPSPATQYSAGGNVWIWYIFSWLPRSAVWRILSKFVGADLIGKKR